MELLIYKASAGSGKTFTLAVEFIKHLMVNPRAYRQILAVTFTNKATAEMKERILTQLNGLATGDPASTPYLDRLKEELKQPDWSDAEWRQRAQTALECLLHDYDRFRVETIDSFFQSVMRNLARELELNPNLNIELNNNEVLDEAVDSLIERLTPDSPVLAWLLEYIEERIREDKRWNVAQEIKAFGRNIFDEEYIERGESLRHTLHDLHVVKQYREMLQALEEEVLEQMKGFNEQLECELEGHNLSTEDLAGKSKGISSYFRKLANGVLTDKEVKNATLQKHLDDPANWSSKTHKRRNEIVQLAQETLIPLLEDAERLRPVNCRTLLSCRLSLQHLNKLQLLNHIDQEVRRLNQEHNRFLLSDTNALLHNLMREGDSSFVFEKIGANLRNVMIDEFQDTSRMQWDNFRLLLLEGLSQGADSLIVGDVKQSIYRWRNGDWSILNNLGLPNSDFPFPVRVETLKVNRRSETHIIDFNNHLFRQAVANLNERHVHELNEACYPLQNAYADIEQASPRSEQRGHVQGHFIEAENEQEYTEQTLQELGAKVKEIIDAGVKPDDIAILVRKNKNIPAIADYFDQELQLRIVSDEAFRLDASPAVCLLIDALRYLADPQQRIARASLLLSYMQRMDHADLAWDDCLRGKLEELLPADFTLRRDELRLMPLQELLEELYRLFDLQQLAGQDAYLLAFFDAVAEFLQNAPSDLQLFLSHWEEKLCSKTIAGGAVSGIHIYSIHKSKGLEFHTVLIPFCDWKLENETNNQLVWCQPPVTPFNELPLVPVNYSRAMAESIYRNDYLKERLQLWVDNLNLLYVAFTRAGKNLFFWSKQGATHCIAELLADALPQLADEGVGQWNDATGSFTLGTLCPSTEPASQPSRQADTNRLTQQPTGLPIQMQSLKSQAEFKQSNQSADFIAGIDEAESRQRFLHRGCLLHALFERIRTRADIPSAIDRMVFDGLIGNRQQEEEIRHLTDEAFALPLVQEWYSGQWQLFNECDIIWMEQNQLHNQRPDRVMMRGDEIVVVDFKFGQPRKHYAQQVQGYLQLLARMGYPTTQMRGYLWYVDAGRIEEISFTQS